MDKWFKLANEWYNKQGFDWKNGKENWQKFVEEIKKIWNIKKVGWNLLDFEETRRKLLPEKVIFEECFEVKERKYNEKR